jgi:ferredoxin
LSRKERHQSYSSQSTTSSFTRQWNRFRQRVYHKFVYYPDKFGRILCTGCGRCIEACPARMDLIEILEGLTAKEGSQS